jgi:hypothetical protein
MRRRDGLRQKFVTKFSNVFVISMILTQILDLIRSWHFIKLFQYSPQEVFHAVISLHISLPSSRVVLVGFDIQDVRFGSNFVSIRVMSSKAVSYIILQSF